MTQQELKNRRRRNPRIHTDAEGNLIGYNPGKLSGTKFRKEHRIGKFKKHDGTGTYEIFCNAVSEDKDERVE